MILSKSWQIPIYVKLAPNLKFHEILWLSSRATLAIKFLSHTERHTNGQTYPEIVKSFSEHPKTYKYVKNQESKIFMKLILSSIYAEENKK